MATKQLHDQGWEYEIQGHYSAQYGWESVMRVDTLSEAREELRSYDENEPRVPHRIHRVRA